MYLCISSSCSSASTALFVEVTSLFSRSICVLRVNSLTCFLSGCQWGTSLVPALNRGHQRCITRHLLLIRLVHLS